jgi:hypothetical protein
MASSNPLAVVVLALSNGDFFPEAIADDLVIAAVQTSSKIHIGPMNSTSTDSNAPMSISSSLVHLRTSLEISGDALYAGSSVFSGPSTFSNALTVAGNALYAGSSVFSGPSTFSNALTVSSNMFVEGVITCTSLNQTSDRSLNIGSNDITNALFILDKLKPQTYTKLPNNAIESGFISQDVLESVPELTHLISSADPNSSTTLSMNYIGLIAYLVRAVQELDIRTK